MYTYHQVIPKRADARRAAALRDRHWEEQMRLRWALSAVLLGMLAGIKPALAE